MIALLMLAPQGQADVAIARTDLDGTGVDPWLINRGGAGEPSDLAVEAGHLYWIRIDRGLTDSPSDDTSAIARANLDGSEVDPSFIAGIPGPSFGLAANDQHLYWSEQNGGAIGRANLDGTSVDPAFVTGLSAPYALAVSAQHLYWTSVDGIGRANLDGSAVNPSFISGVAPGEQFAGGLALDAFHIYWTDGNGAVSFVGRANLDGTGVEQDFFVLGGAFAWPGDVAVDDAHIYVALLGKFDDGAVLRFNLFGTYETTPIVDDDMLYGVAVDDSHIYATHPADTKIAYELKAAKTQRQTGKKVVVRIEVSHLYPDRQGEHVQESVTVFSTGRIESAKRSYKLKPKTTAVEPPAITGSDSTIVKLRPKHRREAKIVDALRQGKKVRAEIEATLTDEAGNVATENARVRLKRAR
jgi:hypothetical protein